MRKDKRMIAVEELTQALGPWMNDDAIAAHGVAEAIARMVEALTGKKSPGKEPSEGARIWDAYKDAFINRHGHEPKRNAMVNAQAVQLVKRLGVDDAIAVVQFYLQQSDAFYFRNMHPLALCLKDAETLFAKMKTGKVITRRAADRVETSSATVSASSTFLAKKYGSTPRGAGE